MKKIFTILIFPFLFFGCEKNAEKIPEKKILKTEKSAEKKEISENEKMANCEKSGGEWKIFEIENEKISGCAEKLSLEKNKIFGLEFLQKYCRDCRGAKYGDFAKIEKIENPDFRKLIEKKIGDRNFWISFEKKFAIFEHEKIFLKMDFVAPNKFLILQILHSIKNSPRGGRVFSCGNKKIEIINLKNTEGQQIFVLFYDEKNMGFLHTKYQQFFEHPQCDENILTIDVNTYSEGGARFLEKYFFGDEKIEIKECGYCFIPDNCGEKFSGNDWIFFDKNLFGKILKRKDFEFKRKMTKKECAEIFENWEKNSKIFKN